MLYKINFLMNNIKEIYSMNYFKVYYEHYYLIYYYIMSQQF